MIYILQCCQKGWHQRGPNHYLSEKALGYNYNMNPNTVLKSQQKPVRHSCENTPGRNTSGDLVKCLWIKMQFAFMIYDELQWGRAQSSLVLRRNSQAPATGELTFGIFSNLAQKSWQINWFNLTNILNLILVLTDRKSSILWNLWCWT